MDQEATIMSNTQLYKLFGKPGKNLVRVEFAYKMKLSWDNKVNISSTLCHKSVAKTVKSIFDSILNHYGKDEIERLRLNQFGGCYNHRLKRGGKTLSHHSWGIAIDLDPINNQLKWNHKKAKFAKDEYKPLMDIFYNHGWFNLGKEKNYDWMHFESGFTSKID